MTRNHIGGSPVPQWFPSGSRNHPQPVVPHPPIPEGVGNHLGNHQEHQKTPPVVPRRNTVEKDADPTTIEALAIASDEVAALHRRRALNAAKSIHTANRP